MKNKQEYTRFNLKFNNDRDALVIKALQNSRNKTGYVRDLIMLDLMLQERTQLRLSDLEYTQVLKHIERIERR